MKFIGAVLLGLGVTFSSIAVCADAPLVVETLKLNKDQEKQFNIAERLKLEYDRVAAPYDKEVDAWFNDAAIRYQKATSKNSGMDWRLERKDLLKKLQEIQSRKDPRIDQLDQQMEAAFREAMRTLPPRRK